MELNHVLVDKFEESARILLDLLDDPNSLERVQLALAEAKRVRRTSTILIRELAKLRDDLQA